MNARSEAAWAAFRARVEELGGTVLEGEWLGVMKPHRVRCAAGHECTPRPNSVQKGRGICRVCAGQDSAAAEAAFRARVEELGGTVLEPSWLGVNTPHRVRCAAGHECTPRPNHVQQGKGVCRMCAGNDPLAAEAAFRARVAELGGTVLELSWLGNKAAHRVRCREGHECTPRPNHVQQGQGICGRCAGRDHDAVYVVSGGARVKVGVTKGDPRGRLGDHRRDHLPRVHRTIAGLPEGVAKACEDFVLDHLEALGVRPVQGNEYFNRAQLGRVQSAVDGWLGEELVMTPQCRRHPLHETAAEGSYRPAVTLYRDADFDAA